MTDFFCTSCLYEDYDGAEEPCINCVRAKDEKPTEYFPKRPTKPMTWGDKIRSMTDEELAGIMVGDCPPNYPHGNCREYEKVDGNLDCCKCWLDWLKSPMEVIE